MKSKIINIIKAVLFVTIFVIGLYFLYQTFRWKDSNGGYLYTFDALAALNENTVDVLFLGPSVTYGTMNPATFWDEYGYATFTMSISGQDKNSTVACLKEVLKTQRPKVVMVDAFGSLFEKHAVRSNVYRNTIGMDLNYNNIQLIRRAVDKDEQLDFILRWPIVHTRYTELTRYDFEKYMPSVYMMGYVYGFGAIEREPVEDSYYSDEVTPISDSNKKWVDELVDISREYGFTLAFYLTPGVTSNKSSVNGFSEYLSEHNIDFLDMNTGEFVKKLNYSTDFADAVHLNYFGGTKVQQFIGEYLSTHYSLEDCRDRQGYDAWQLASKYKRHILTDKEMQETGDLVNLAEIAMEMDDLVFVLSMEGDTSNCETDIFGALDVCGVPEMYEAGGTVVFDNGREVYYTSGNGQYRLKVNSADTMNICRVVDEKGSYTNVYVGRDSLRNGGYYFNGIYVCVYDKFTGQNVFEKYFY